MGHRRRFHEGEDGEEPFARSDSAGEFAVWEIPREADEVVRAEDSAGRVEGGGVGIEASFRASKGRCEAEVGPGAPVRVQKSVPQAVAVASDEVKPEEPSTRVSGDAGLNDELGEEKKEKKKRKKSVVADEEKDEIDDLFKGVEQKSKKSRR